MTGYGAPGASPHVPPAWQRQRRGTHSLSMRHSATSQQFLGAHTLGSARRPDLPHRCSALAQVNLGFAPSSSGTELPSPSTGLRRRRTKRPAQPQTSLCFRRKCAVLQASQEVTVAVSMKQGGSTSMAHLGASAVPRRAAGGDKHQLTNSLMSTTGHKNLRNQGRR